jgi:hypothetical protein
MKTKESIIMDVYFQTTPAYQVKHEVFEGKDYLVIPVVMMVEGVHSGSHGPILHTAEELGKFPASWDGIPVTLNHPNVDGQYVSANSPEILKDWAIGTIFNTHMEGKMLHAEAWIDQIKLMAFSPTTLEKINKGEIIEVSVGVFSDEDDIEGVFMGTDGMEQYKAIARNHRPNHLALLPDEIGACSIMDGCGLRVNKKGGLKMNVLVNEQNEQQVLKELSLKGFSFNQTGFQERANKAQQMLNQKDNETSYFYLEEIFENEMVYQVHSRLLDGTRTSKFYKQSYQENAAGEVELTGEAVQVKRLIEYPVVSVATNTQEKEESININEKEKNIMSEKCTPCVKAKVDTLIANKALSYAETDREWLEGLGEDQLEKMTPTVPIAVHVKEKVTKEDVIQVMKGFTLEEHLSTMPLQVRDQIQTGLRINAERKTAMITEILANENSPWEKEDLEALTPKVLEKVFATVSVNKMEENSFIAYGGGFIPEMEETVPLVLPFGLENKQN